MWLKWKIRSIREGTWNLKYPKYLVIEGKDLLKLNRDLISRYINIKFSAFI